MFKKIRHLKFWLKHNVRFSVYRHPYTLSKNGHWPFGVWAYRWGIACHFRTIADMRLEFGAG